MPTKNRARRQALPTAVLAAREDSSRCVLKVDTDLAASAKEPENPVEPVIEKLAWPVSAPAARANQRFGSYELVWEIRRDALSTTWAAQREGIDRPLAIRIFNVRVTDSAQVRSIQKAARKTSELTHSNHVTVYESGVGEDGAPYVVADWIEGDTLAETFLVNKRLDIAGFLDIFNQVGEALIEAHSLRLVHGNLSPNKIILVHQDDVETDIVKLIDFGMPPDPVQNAFYLSPEQCLDRNKADERSDIYSLGCIMHESLVGSPPFIGDKVSQASTNYLHELANQYGKDAPEHNALKLLDCIIVKCLQKKPSKRFRNVRELMDALRLVNDCICNGSRRKLPHKAEKLLLFRFLDFFDKKIVTCTCAYLILGLVSLKYIGEIQMQGFIDEAQLFSSIDLPLSTNNWKQALNQAQLLHKPPSLRADLEWELANALVKQADEAKTLETRNAFADEARKHYEEAYKYYGRGQHYRSYALALLQNMSSLWLSKENPQELSTLRNAARKNVKRLFEQKKFEQCIKAANDFLNKHSDEEIALYAGCANNEIGTTLPDKKALRYFERAEFLFSQSGSFDPQTSTNAETSNVHKCLKNLGYDPVAQDTRMALGCEALADGDLDVAQYELSHVGGSEATDLFVAICNYRFARQNSLFDNSIGSKHAIEPLERCLELQEKAYGKHETALASTLSSLARCYRNQNADQKAIDTYKRLLSIASNPVPDDVIAYVDLLAKNGHGRLAREELEKRVTDKNGKIKSTSEYLPHLMRLYASDKMTAQAMHTIESVVKVPQKVKLWTYYPTNYRRRAEPFPTVAPDPDGDPFAGR